MNFLSPAHKQKKILIFVFLISGLLVAGNQAYAASDYISSSFLGNIFDGLGSAITENVKQFGTAIILAVADVLLSIAQSASSYAVGLFNIIASAILSSWPITKEAVFIIGWQTTRDLANMLIVLGFVIVGIATILRLREYEAQKLLPLLIIIALLINFSPLFCGLIIDASNILMKTFLGLGGNQLGQDLHTRISSAATNVLTDSLRQKSPTEYLEKAVTFIITYILISLTLFYTSFILIIRYAALGILFILSPLAFFCWIFPKTKNLWNKWWETFLKWCFVGAQGAFFIYIAAKMLESYNNAGISFNDKTLIIVLALLVVGFKVTLSTSGMGATAAVTLASGALGFAAGAAMGATKWAGKRAADSRTGRWIGDRATAAGERMGLVSRGSLAQRLESRQKEASGRINLLSKDERARIAKGAAFTAEQKQNKAAAIRSLIASGDSDTFKTPQERAKAMAFVTSAGYRTGKGADEIKDFSKQDYRWAMNDNAKVKKYMDDHHVDETTAQNAVATQQLELNWGGMNAIQRRNVNVEHLSDDFIMSRTGADMKTFRSAPGATRLHLRNRLRDLSGKPGAPGQLNTALTQAHNSGDVSEERRLINLRNELSQIQAKAAAPKAAPPKATTP